MGEVCEEFIVICLQYQNVLNYTNCHFYVFCSKSLTCRLYGAMGLLQVQGMLKLSTDFCALYQRLTLKNPAAFGPVEYQIFENGFFFYGYTCIYLTENSPLKKETQTVITTQLI